MTERAVRWTPEQLARLEERAQAYAAVLVAQENVPREQALHEARQAYGLEPQDQTPRERPPLSRDLARRRLDEIIASRVTDSPRQITANEAEAAKRRARRLAKRGIVDRKCRWCGAQLPPTVRSDQFYCSVEHRYEMTKESHKLRRAGKPGPTP